LLIPSRPRRRVQYHDQAVNTTRHSSWNYLPPNLKTAALVTTADSDGCWRRYSQSEGQRDSANLFYCAIETYVYI